MLLYGFYYQKKNKSSSLPKKANRLLSIFIMVFRHLYYLISTYDIGHTYQIVCIALLGYTIAKSTYRFDLCKKLELKKA